MLSRAPVASPVGLLPRRTHHWSNGFVLTGAGIASYGMLPLLDQPGLASPALAAGITAGSVVVVRGELVRRRAAIHDSLVEALTLFLGTKAPSRQAVRLSRWSMGWPGTPHTVVIHYASAAKDLAPDWRSTIGDLINQRLDASFMLKKHDRRRCRMVYQLEPVIEQIVSGARQRIDRTIIELIGTTAKVRRVEFDDEENPVRIEVGHQAGTKLAAAGYRARIERTLSSILPGRWRARWDLENDEVTFELRASFPPTIQAPPVEVDPSSEILTTYDRVEIPFAVDEDGKIQVWRPAIDPNLMVVGAPGTGKTVLEHAILAQVARYGWPIWVVDGKAVEFLGFRSWPNVQVVATTIDEQVAVIERAWELMERRYQLIVQGKAVETDFEPIMLFLDEFADFRSNLQDWYVIIKRKGDPTKPSVLAKVASIARKGRTARVHLLFATQRPDAEYFGGDMRDNFRMRISMGRLSPQGAMMMWHDPSTGTTIPRGCRGRATTIDDNNRAVEIQTFYVPDPRKVLRTQKEEEIQHLDQLRPDTSRHDRFVIIPASSRDLDAEEPSPPSYRDVAAAEWARAADRPDLDPLAEGSQTQRGNARELASPLSILGITQGHRPLSRLHLVPDPPSEVEPPAVGDDEWDVFEGYGPTIDLPAEDLTIGDLVLVDESAGHWAVVDADPDLDLSDPDCMAVPWRDDADNEGIVLLPDGGKITARRPHDEDGQ